MDSILTTLRCIKICIASLFCTSLAAMSGCMCENPTDRTGFSSRIFAILTEVKAETLGFSFLTLSGREIGRHCDAMN